MNNTIIAYRSATIIAGAIIAIASAKLTFEFMSELSSTLGVIGLLMESVKFFAPMVALYAWRNGDKARALILASIVSLLVAMSFIASMSAVDNGFQDTRQRSAQYQVLTEQIELLKTQAYEKRKAAESLPESFRTKRLQLLNDAAGIDAQIADRLDSLVSVESDSIALGHGKLIAVAAALIIELLTVSTTIAVSVFRAGNEREQTDTKPCSLNVPAVPENKPEQSGCVESKIMSGLYIKAFESPSVAGIRKSVTGIRSAKISEILKRAGDLGLLVPRGNGLGWRYAN